jgi:hypothetical protein
MDVEMEDAVAAPSSPTANHHQQHHNHRPPEADMGYEECSPAPRRGSMTHDEERHRRASIKAVMADTTMSPMAKRRSIQHLMDGRHSSINTACSNSSGEGLGLDHSLHQQPVLFVSNGNCSTTSVFNNSQTSEFNAMGYGDSYHSATEAGMDGSNSDNDNTMFASFGGGSISNEQTRRAEQTRPPCPHYERNCTMIAPCCGGAFGCRICHDDCPNQCVYLFLSNRTFGFCFPLLPIGNHMISAF